jgi:hypothetical protein
MLAGMCADVMREAKRDHVVAGLHDLEAMNAPCLLDDRRKCEWQQLRNASIGPRQSDDVLAAPTGKEALQRVLAEEWLADVVAIRDEPLQGFPADVALDAPRSICASDSFDNPDHPKRACLWPA